MYPSCPKDYQGRACQKKMTDSGNGSFFCERCTAYSNEPVYKYLVNLQ